MRRNLIIMIKISIWTDYACPFCYIAEGRLDNLIAEMGIADRVEYDYHSFELYPDAPKDVTETTVVRFAKKYGLTEEEAAYRIDKISQMGEAEGLTFKYASTLNTNSMDAHRLTQYAKSLNDPLLTKKVMDLLFKAYFSDNQKLADHDVLLDIAKKAGLELASVKKVLESNEYYDEVRADENFVMTRGINAVPFIVIDGKGVMGAQSKKIFKQLLTEALAKENKATK